MYTSEIFYWNKLENTSQYNYTPPTVNYLYTVIMITSWCRDFLKTTMLSTY